MKVAMSRFHKCVLAFINILEGLIVLMSISYIEPKWSLKFCFWSVAKRATTASIYTTETLED